MKIKIVAILTGILTTILIGFTSIFWGKNFVNLANYLSSDYTEKLFGVWPFNDNTNSDFYLYYILGLAIALGLLVTFILWDIGDVSRSRLIIYIPFLILILGFSVYNYINSDNLIRPDIQAGFNLLIICLGLFCSIQLWHFKAKSTDGIVLKYIILFILILCSVFIPFYFSISWFFKRVGLNEINLSFNMPIITTIASVITCVITVLKYENDKTKE
ncbi:MAG TPA: hypothetical protein VK590_15760 [Saprospiraceae bacterium]|nr:hypothetical protein [Saprospiraceae bacterium]